MELNSRLFWYNVKQLRENKRLTQPQVAELAGMNPKNYNYKERGFAKKLLLEEAEAVAKALDTTVEELLQGEVPDEPLINPEVATFWENVRVRREQLRLSQAEIARRISMAPGNYQIKESGKAAKLPPDLAESVASALDTTVEELMGTNDTSTESEHASETHIPHVTPTVKRLKSDKEILSAYPEEVQEWLNSPVSWPYVFKAWNQYLKDKGVEFI